MKRQALFPLMLALALLAVSCAGRQSSTAGLHRSEECPTDPATLYEGTVESVVGTNANEYELLWGNNALGECHERRGEFRQAYQDYYAAWRSACENERLDQEVSLDAEVARNYCDEYGPQALERVGARLSPQEREEIQAEEEGEETQN